MSALQRGDKVFVADFSGGAFHHKELAAKTGIKKIDIALSLLLVSRVDNPLAVDTTDANATDWAHKRDFTDVKSCRGSIHSEEIAFAGAIALDESRIDLNIIVVTFREERADRTIAHTSGENLLARRARFTLEEAAGKLTCSVKLLTILTLKREEINPLAWSIGVGNSRKDCSITV